MRVVSGLMFFPRGGSAHVARALARTLPDHGWEVTVVSGSLSAGPGDARDFYAGLDVHPVDFDAGDAPMHPSYEDRPDAPDVCFARVDDRAFEQHVAAWRRALKAAAAGTADVLHLSHLTPLNEAAAAVAPGVPIAGHLHGTELLMLERIAAGPPAPWTYADAWAGRMRRWAQACDRVLLLAEGHRRRAVQLLGVDPRRCVVVGNGVDVERFMPAHVDSAAFWRHVLVDRPLGSRPGGDPGSVAYSGRDVAVLDRAVVLIAVSRFTEVKRLPLLVQAFERARRESGHAMALVIVGGHPGECEGEHPLTAIERVGARDVFLAGWYAQAELPQFFNAADVQVLASVREQFGLVLLEGMACGVPAIAVDRFGPRELVEHGLTGWLVPPDDERALATAIRTAVEDPDERVRLGSAAERTVRARWSWDARAAGVAAVFDELADGRRRHRRRRAPSR